MNHMPEKCPGGELQKGLCETVFGLVPTFSNATEDRADSLLGAHPNPASVIEAHQILIDVMLPGRMTPEQIEAEELSIFLTRRLSQVWRLLRPQIERAIPFRWLGRAAQNEASAEQVDPAQTATAIMRTFFERLPEVRKLLIEDVEAAYEGDPAALSYAEVQLAYPGLLAVASYRLAHELYLLDVPIVPRIMSEWTHSQTGTDIHPGATIGRGFFIDHATGVVIGETTEIGDRVKIYQGVTLGAKSFALDENGNPIKHIKRHPTVEDNVIIYANATILGGDTFIGKGSTIGGNVFLMESVPPNSLVATTHPDLKIKPGR
jgi:serine O-acetyltransferase